MYKKLYSNRGRLSECTIKSKPPGIKVGVLKILAAYVHCTVTENGLLSVSPQRSLLLFSFSEKFWRGKEKARVFVV